MPSKSPNRGIRKREWAVLIVGGGVLAWLALRPHPFIAPPSLEGDYTAWVAKAKVDTTRANFNLENINLSIDNNGLISLSMQTNNVSILVNDTVPTVLWNVQDEAFQENPNMPRDHAESIFRTYHLFRENEANLVHVYKNNIDIATLIPDAVNANPWLIFSAISPNGKYIVIAWCEDGPNIDGVWYEIYTQVWVA